jgi:hypothetical protein
MSLTSAVRIGSQRPRIQSLPAERHASAGAEVVELAAMAGLILDDWQAWFLGESLSEQTDHQWSAFEVGLIVSRQCGKGSVLEARQLGGLTILRERLQVHTAHEFRTCFEHFLRMVQLVESCPDIDRQVARIRRGAGEQAIEMKSGQRLRFLARSGGSGRGMSGDAVYLDEAFALTKPMMGALLPTLSARPNPQIWYTSSAPMASSTVLHDVRNRGIDGTSPRLFFAEWSATEQASPDDVDAWYDAVPALGIRISEEFIHAEREAMPDEEFLRERLGIPDMPVTDKVAPPTIPAEAWQATATTIPHDVAPGGCVFAYDVHDGWASIAIAAGALSAAYVEVVAHQAGDGWLPRRLVELADRWKPISIGLDGGNGPAVAVLGVAREQFEEAGLDPDLLRPITSADYKAACGSFLRSVVDGTLTRPVVAPDQLDNAAVVASERRIGDAFVWDRRTATVPLAPLVAATVARSLLGDKPPAAPAFFYY